MNEHIATTWINFIEKCGLKNEYEDICKNTNISRVLQFNKLIETINVSLAKNKNNIYLLADVFFEYSNRPTYSISESKRILVENIKKLAKKYDSSSIPLLYGILSMTDNQYKIKVFFEPDDYGNLDFISALLELEKEDRIDIVKFEILSILDEVSIEIKATLNLKNLKIKPLGDVYESDWIPDKLESVKSISGLSYYTDGSIKYNGKQIPMRDQIKKICILFIDKYGVQLSWQDIRETIADGEDAPKMTKRRVAQYVSELRCILKQYFKKDVLVNESKSGWTFTLNIS